MNVGSNGRLLTAATRDLSVKWAAAKDGWHDSKSREFENDHLAELFAAIERASGVFEQLDKVITKIRIDCE